MTGGPQAREHHLQVARTARYWTLGEPASARDVWFVLHGYKQLAHRFLRRFEPIADPGRLIVAPEALSRFYVSTERGRHGAASVVGATWMTREERDHEIRDYVAYLDRLAETVLSEVAAARTGPEPLLTVLGFSQGVATAARWATAGALRPQRLLLWGDFTPPDMDMEAARRALAHTEVVMVRGSEDGALSPDLARAEEERLSGAGVAYRRVTYQGGHDIDAATLVGLAAEGVGDGAQRDSAT